ncbi:hypothetical protein [Clostridium formicaceticum]|uniref:Photosynthesis system II assembly factor Ycf48/Hcf136-like domain-containing protein n=1 Tax=Clostridium formicaceticum TaxID=1497 RepID=A0AAC9RHW3_9CLOT|nr:hypothetical protein [Clostridium formicaceticum]AOY76831.1 hypothetical protein BJL90_13800 [Clostridium formicaceticum]ARE87304.1 hypothetical protein CLFO_17030 [Clostridium formicaceticum]
MKYNKLSFLLVLIVIAALLSACSQTKSTNENKNNLITSDNESDTAVDNTEISQPKGILEDLLKDTQGTVNKIALSNMTVEELALTSQGTLYALAEGNLYEIKSMDQVNPINLNKVFSTFHVVESDQEVIIIAGGVNGEIYTYSTLNSKWEEVEIDTKEAPVNIIRSSKDGKIYVGQSSKFGGGLWKSDDKGKSWNKLSDLTVRGITIHPKEQNVLYIVDELAYISTDEGSSFIKINTKANYGILIHPLQSNAIYHAFSIGVETTDIEGNISSYLRFYLEGSMTKLALNPIDVNEWLMGFWNYPLGTGGLYYSTNHGALWSEVEGELIDKLVLDIVFSGDGSIAFVSTKDHGIWTINLPMIRSK